MKIHKTILSLFVLTLSWTSCGASGDTSSTLAPPQKFDRPTSFANDDELLDYIEKTHLNYMWDGAENNSGLAPERIHLDGVYPQNDKDVVTTGGSGFGIAGLIVGIDRGFIDRKEGVKRFQKIVKFLENADRYHGVWSHWTERRWRRPRGKLLLDDQFALCPTVLQGW